MSNAIVTRLWGSPLPGFILPILLAISMPRRWPAPGDSRLLTRRASARRVPGRDTLVVVKFDRPRSRDVAVTVRLSSEQDALMRRAADRPTIFIHLGTGQIRESIPAYAATSQAIRRSTNSVPTLE